MDPRFREGDERSTKASVAGTASAPFAHSRPAGPCRGGRRAMCHEMSCFVMVPYAHGSYPAVGPGMKLSFRSGFRALRPVLSVGVSRKGLSSRSRFVPSVPPCSCGGSLFRAYRVCARGPVGAGAVRAPDCARETADAPLPSVSAGLCNPRCRSSAEKGKGGSGGRLSLYAYSNTLFPQSSPSAGQA